MKLNYYTAAKKKDSLHATTSQWSTINQIPYVLSDQRKARSVEVILTFLGLAIWKSTRTKERHSYSI